MAPRMGPSGLMSASFPRETLQALAEVGFAGTVRNFRVVADDFTSTGRWSVHYRMVFTDGTDYYAVRYERRATEVQDIEPFEDDPAEIQCEQVFPVNRVAIFYERADG